MIYFYHSISLSLSLRIVYDFIYKHFDFPDLGLKMFLSPADVLRLYDDKELSLHIVPWCPYHCIDTMCIKWHIELKINWYKSWRHYHEKDFYKNRELPNITFCWKHTVQTDTALNGTIHTLTNVKKKISNLIWSICARIISQNYISHVAY